MARLTVRIYILTIILVGQCTEAIKNKTGDSLEPVISLYIDGGNSSTWNKQSSDSYCPNLYRNVFGCWQGKRTLREGKCATYDAEKELVSTVDCTFYPNRYKFATPGHILLPMNLSQLNDYMCGPLNRKGLVCSDCADGFGPSVTSFRYRCVSCSDAWGATIPHS